MVLVSLNATTKMVYSTKVDSPVRVSSVLLVIPPLTALPSTAV